MNNYIINLGPNTKRGFFSNLYSTFSLIYSCDGKFYIDWQSGTDYIAKEGANPFDYFFEQPFFETPPIDSKVFSEPGLILHTDVNQEDREKWNEVLTKFLKLKSNIKQPIDEYYNNNFLGKKILCVHKRGSDHGYHKPIQSNSEYFEAIDKEMSLNNYDKIFLATDETSSVDEFSKKYGEKLLYLDNIRTSNQTPIFQMNVDKYQHIKELLMDAYLLSMGDKLIKTKSSLTTMVCYINKDLEYISIDEHIPFR